MAETAAWILNLDGELQAAVGEREMVHMVQAPVLFAVPDTPLHCAQVLVWQDLIVPVMDLAAWLRGRAITRPGPAVAGIFAFQARDTIDYGALLLAGIPARKPVNDAQARELPEQPSGWSSIAIACFTEGDKPVPVLDLGHVFSDALLNPA